MVFVMLAYQYLKSLISSFLALQQITSFLYKGAHEVLGRCLVTKLAEILVFHSCFFCTVTSAVSVEPFTWLYSEALQ